MNQPSLRIPLLDTLRASAILLVMGHHFRHLSGAPEWFKWIFVRGYVGVDIFFVLSGYLIGAQLLREVKRSRTLNVKRFLIKRWLRTLPAYYAVLLALLMLQVVKLTSIPSMVFFLQNYTEPHSWLITWSLCIEEHFYLAMPLLLAPLIRVGIGQKSAWLLALLLIAVSPVLRALRFELITSNSYEWYIGEFYALTHLRLDGLAVGVAIAALQVWDGKLWRLLSRQAAFCGLAGATLVLLSGWGPGLTGWTADESFRLGFFASVLQPLGLALGVGLMIIYGVSDKAALVPRIAGSFTIAELAYSLYLVHFTVFQIVNGIDALRGIGFLPNLLLAVGGSLLTALALHRGVERPGLELRNKVLGR